MSERPTPPPAAVAGALVLDAVFVVVFAVVGRLSHAEGADVVGVLTTAWPFLAGLALGWAAARAWRHPFALWPTGVVVWAVTLVAGMLLRVVSGQGTAVAFIVVAALTLALLLLGWRTVATVVGRRRRTDVSPG